MNKEFMLGYVSVSNQTKKKVCLPKMHILLQSGYSPTVPGGQTTSSNGIDGFGYIYPVPANVNPTRQNNIAINCKKEYHKR